MTIKQQGGIFGRNPTFNNVDVEGTLTVNGEPISDFGTMAQQDANNVNIDGGSIDNVTIGGSTAAIAVTSKLLTSTGTAGNIQTDSAGNRISMTRPGANYLVASTSGGTLNFGTNGVDTQAYIDTSGNLNCLTGNVVMANGKGIDFSATSGTGTSELFDDYEEGTWTPTYAPSTGSFTSITYGNTGGVYTKIGNICIVSGYISTSALDTTGGSGAIKVGGLPYGIAGSSGGTRDAWRGGSIGYSAGWSGERPSSVFASGGASDFRIMYRSNATSDSSYVLVADMDTSGSNEIAFTLTYRV